MELSGAVPTNICLPRILREAAVLGPHRFGERAHAFHPIGS